MQYLRIKLKYDVYPISVVTFNVYNVCSAITFTRR